MNITFQRETTDVIETGLVPLLFENQAEIDAAHPEFQGLKFEPRMKDYAFAEELGHLYIYTARGEGGELLGYMILHVFESPRYRHLVAHQDMFFIKKSARGFGLKFLRWIDEQLKEAGVLMVYQASKIAMDIGPIYRRAGYTPHEVLYIKRLDAK